jgi:hypothetical protein
VCELLLAADTKIPYRLQQSRLVSYTEFSAFYRWK